MIDEIAIQQTLNRYSEGAGRDWEQLIATFLPDGVWDIAVLGPHYSGALVARDLDDSGPDRERRFEFVLTFERTLVADVAAALISRLSS